MALLGFASGGFPDSAAESGLGAAAAAAGLPDSLTPEDAFLALHEELLLLRHERTALASEMAGMQRSARQAARAHRDLERRLREAEGRARDAESRARDAEVRVRDADGRAEKAARRAEEAARRAEEAERLAREAEDRGDAAEAKAGAAEKVAAAAEERAAALERQRSSLQGLIEGFKARAVQLRGELEQARARTSAALGDAVRFVETASEPAAALFRFDDDEIRQMSARVMQNMVVPSDLRYLRQLFRVPSDDLDETMRARLSEMSAASGRASAAQLCHSASPQWKRLRRCMYSFWQMTAWDALRLRPLTLHTMLLLTMEYVTEYAALGGGGGDGDGDACSLPDEEARRALVERMGSRETLRQRMCAELGLGARRSMYGDAEMPDSEGAKVVVSALFLSSHEAGTPWAKGVRALIDKREPDDPVLARLTGDEAAHRWLESEHGIYVFDTGRSRIYRYVHPPHELQPVSVLGLTMEELFAGGQEKRTAAARARCRRSPRLLAAPTGSLSVHGPPPPPSPSSGGTPPSPSRSAALGRYWLRDARVLISDARQMLQEATLREFGPVEDPAQGDVLHCRMLAQLLSVTARLSVTDFATNYRACMQASHCHWVVDSLRAHLSGEDPPKRRKRKPAKPQVSPAAYKPTAPGLDEPQMQFEVAVADEDHCPRRADEVGPSESEGQSPEPASPKTNGFALPTIGMPATQVTVPSEIRYLSAHHRCRVPATVPVQRSAIALELSRQVKARVYLTFCDEPEPSQLEDFADWSAMMDAYREHGLTLPENAEKGESSAKESSYPATPSQQRAMENTADGQSVNRFVFAHCRGMFVGMRIHVFVMCPRVVAPDLDLAGFAQDMVHVTQVALGAMIGMQRPLCGMGQDNDAGKRWGDLFFPPRRAGEAMMLELIKALYTTVHSDALLELYA